LPTNKNLQDEQALIEEVLNRLNPVSITEDEWNQRAKELGVLD